jgi:hypothetical protein
VSRLVRLLDLGRSTVFVFNDVPREINDPDGPATARQLRRLNELGLLTVVEPGQVPPLTKAEAAWTLDVALKNEAA